MNEEKQIPEDHPIREIWRFNRLDTAMLIELAKSGDTDAARCLMARYSHYKHIAQEAKEIGVTHGPNKERDLVEEYILEAIRLSLRTGDANEGFNLKGKNANRPVSSYREKMEQCDIGYRVAVLIDEMPSKSKAYFIAAKEFNISEAKARHYYEMYMKID